MQDKLDSLKGENIQLLEGKKELNLKLEKAEEEKSQLQVQCNILQGDIEAMKAASSKPNQEVIIVN